MDKKEYYLYVKGKAVPVSEEVYKAYWKITEHEKYLQRKDWKHNVIPFSALDHDGHFVETITDERIDLEKIVEALYVPFITKGMKLVRVTKDIEGRGKDKKRKVLL